MGVRFPTSGNTTRLTNTIVTTAETIIITSQPLNLTLDFSQVLIWWYLLLTIGTGGTGATVNIRRGATLTGPIINLPSAQTVVAGNGVVLSGCYADTPGAVAAQQYSLTATIAAATANTTVTDAAMIAMAL